ncbi:MAG: chloride channel protein [Myxococcales bacterium]|nr:chloride channel protein [Myxococcales bacterium]
MTILRQMVAQASQRTLNRVWFSLLAVLIGVVAGFGAVAFRLLIALFHNLFFLGRLSLTYDANVHTPASPWGPLVILVPVVGALGVVFLVRNFAPEAKGHGVPEVMDAIYYRKGIIRPVVGFVKSIASALSIGSGGSVGREGPIIQIGSSFGSAVAQWINVPAWQRITMIACGAGGGIAATFNTPVGGVLFAVDILMHEVSSRTLVPVAISTATAAYITRWIYGDHPSFVIPAFETPYFHFTKPYLLLAYVVLGLLIGLVSTVYIRSIYAFEDLFEKRIKGHDYLRHALGMLLVGILFYLVMLGTGHYHIQGVGYATIQDVLGDKQRAIGLLLLLFVLKLLATSLTLGSGASGGVFSPALFFGATLGGAFGLLLELIMPGTRISVPGFAVAGMAGVVGSTTGAAMAAIVMIFEMTRDYDVIIPMTITVAVSYGVRRSLSRRGIYSLKMARRGHYMPEALQANFLFMRRARDVMSEQFTLLSQADSAMTPAPSASEPATSPTIVVTEGEQVVRVCPRQPFAGECTWFAVSVNDSLFDVVAGMRAANAHYALVFHAGPVEDRRTTNLAGVIGKEQLADALVDTADLFGD